MRRDSSRLKSRFLLNDVVMAEKKRAQRRESVCTPPKAPSGFVPAIDAVQESNLRPLHLLQICFLPARTF